MTIQQMHIYKYAQSHTVCQQHVSDTSVTIIRDSCYKNTINIQFRTKMYDKTTQYYT